MYLVQFLSKNWADVINYKCKLGLMPDWSSGCGSSAQNLEPRHNNVIFTGRGAAGMHKSFL